MNGNTLCVPAFNDINILLHSTLFYSVIIDYEIRIFAISFNNLHRITINIITLKLCKTVRLYYEIQEFIKKR
jgi:hypothetical protein